MNTIVDQVAQEPDSGTSTLTFTAVLAYATDHSISIPVATADNTALAGTTLDYLAASTTLVIGAGAISASQTITINADLAQESDQTFYWNATLPSGMTGDTQAVATIRDSSTFGADTRGEENSTIPQSAALVVPIGNPFSASSLDPPAGIDPASIPAYAAPVQNSLGSIDAFNGSISAAIPVAGQDLLIYNSGTSNPKPAINIDTSLRSSAPVPTSIEATLVFNSVSYPVVYYSTTGLSAGASLHFALQADASSLATGRYPWEVTLTAKYSGGTSYSRKFAGAANVVNRTNSEFGSGWSVLGLDRLYIQSDGVLLVKGDNTALWFAQSGTNFTRPAEDVDFSTLVKNGDNTFTRTTKYGAKQNFSTLGLLTAPIDPNSNSGSYTYIDADSDTIADELQRYTDPTGRQWNYAYASGKLDYIDDFVTPTARRTDVTVTSGKLTGATLPAGAAGTPTLAFAYAGVGGRMSQWTDEVGRATNIAYDYAATVDTLTNPDSTTWQVDALQSKGLVDTGSGIGTSGNPSPLYVPSDAYARIVDPLSHATRWTADRLGNPLVVTDVLSNVTTVQRAASGLITSITTPDPDGAAGQAASTTQFQLDTLGNITQITLPDGKTRSFSYDSTWNRVLTITDELSRQRIFTIDSANGNVLTDRRVIGLVDGAGNSETNDLLTTYTYTTTTPKGQVDLVTDPNGNITDYGYSSRGLPTSVIYAKGTSLQASVSIEYNTADQRTAYMDELGRRSEWTVDGLNRITQFKAADPDGPSNPLTSPITNYEYDLAARITKVTDALSRQTTYAYTNYGKHVTTTKPDHNSNGFSTISSFDLDAAGNLVTVTDALSRVSQFEFDSLNRQWRDTLPDPDGVSGPLSSPQWTYGFDNMSRRITTTAPAPYTNTAPTVAAPIGTVNATQGASKTTIDLAAAFADAQDADSALRYTVESNTNPALFDSVSLSTDNPGKLILDYVNNASGSATFVVRATDTNGSSVTDTFTVSVAAVPANEFGVNGTTLGEQIAPDVAFLADGSFVVVWSGPGGPDADGVYARHFSASGTALAGEFKVNTTTTGVQSQATVTALAAGGYVVVWTDAGNSNDIFMQRYSAADAVQGTETRVNTTTTNSQALPAVAALTGGGYVVSWNGNGTGDSAGVFFQRYDATGIAQGSETRANATTTGTQADSDVTGVLDGGFVVVWRGAGPTGSDADGVYGRRYKSDGTAIDSAEFLINVTTGGTAGTNQTLPAIAADGSFYVAWQTNSVDTNDVMVRKFAADGTPASGEIQANTTTTATAQKVAAIAVTPDGGFVVAWEGNGTGDSSGVFMRRFALDMQAQSTEERLNNTTTGTQSAVRIDAFSGDGRLVAAWQAPDGTGNGNGVFARLMQASAPAGAYAGPFRIVSSFGQNVLGSVDRALVTFSQPVLDSSFTTADVTSFTGPSGSISATSITKISTAQYLVNFASQSTAGAYSLVLGPDITTAAGTKLDQDWDGTTGEATDDQFAAMFYISAGAATAAAVTSFQYDLNSRMTRVTAADGGQTNVTYTFAGEVATVSDPLSRLMSYSRDDAGRVTRVTRNDPDGAGGAAAPYTDYAYDKNGNVRFVTSALSNQTEYVYDARNRLTDIWQPDPSGAVPGTRPHTVVTFDAAGQTTAVADPLGRTTQFAYDNLGRLITKTGADPDDGGSLLAPVWSYAYTAMSMIQTVTEPDPDSTGSLLSPVTDYSYDALYNVTSVTLADPDGPGSATRPVWTFAYDDAAQLLSSSDPLSRTSYLTYDQLGRVLSETLPDPDSGGPLLSPVSMFGYDPSGNMIRETDALGRVTQHSFDLLNREISTIDALGGVASVTFDLAGQAIRGIDELGRFTVAAYDGLGRTTSVTSADPDGPFSLASPVRQFGYDAEDNLVSMVDARGYSSSRAYDHLNRLTTITGADPDGAGSGVAPVTSFVLDAAGQRTSVTEPLSRTTSFAYDKLSRVTTITEMDPDGAGSGVAPVTTRAYDALSRLISVTSPDPDQGGSQEAPVTSYAYDALDRLTTLTAPDPDGAAGGLSRPVTSYSYNAANELTHITSPMSTDTSIVLDNLGRRTSVTDELNQTTSFAYDSVDNLTKTTDAQGYSTVNTFDALDRLIGIRDARHGYTSVAFDAVGNVMSLTDPTLNVTQYQYDRLDRRVSDTNQLGGRRTWAYDAEDNLTKQTDRNGRVREFTFDGLNRETQEQWKTSGSLVRTISFAFDTAGELTSASDPDSAYAFAYDQLGRVTSVDNNGTPGVPRVILTSTFDTLSRRTGLSATIAGTLDFKNTATYDGLDRLTRLDQTG